MTAGTIFQDTRTPLTTLFRAIWWVTSQKNGVNALGLKQILGLGSYQTAWSWLHKLRRAMVRPRRERLNGAVEIDETHRGAAEGVRGRKALNKLLIVVAVEQVGSHGLGGSVSAVSPASGESLQAFIDETIEPIEPGTAVTTDGWVAYDRLKAHGYDQRVIFLKGCRESAADLLSRVHRVASLLKR